MSDYKAFVEIRSGGPRRDEPIKCAVRRYDKDSVNTYKDVSEASLYRLLGQIHREPGIEFSDNQIILCGFVSQGT